MLQDHDGIVDAVPLLELAMTEVNADILTRPVVVQQDGRITPILRPELVVVLRLCSPFKSFGEHRKDELGLGDIDPDQCFEDMLALAGRDIIDGGWFDEGADGKAEELLAVHCAVLVLAADDSFCRNNAENAGMGGGGAGWGRRSFDYVQKINKKISKISRGSGIIFKTFVVDYPHPTSPPFC